MFILLHEIKGHSITEVLINVNCIEHIKLSENGGKDTYVRIIRQGEKASFFFVRESVKEIYEMINRSATRRMIDDPTPAFAKAEAYND